MLCRQVRHIHIQLTCRWPLGAVDDISQRGSWALAARVNSGPHTPAGNEDAIGRLFSMNARLTLK
jgi:hypothetical protein